MCACMCACISCVRMIATCLRELLCCSMAVAQRVRLRDNHLRKYIRRCGLRSTAVAACGAKYYCARETGWPAPMICVCVRFERWAPAAPSVQRAPRSGACARRRGAGKEPGKPTRAPVCLDRSRRALVARGAARQWWRSTQQKRKASERSADDWNWARPNQEKMERVMRFELTTVSLATRGSTTELHSHRWWSKSYGQTPGWQAVFSFQNRRPTRVRSLA